MGVGTTEAVALNVHRGNLSKSSEYFRNMLKPEWASMRDEANTIHLNDDCATTVKAYTTWLYTDTVPWDMDSIGRPRQREERAQEAEKVYIELAKAYVYGEKIMDTKYKNMVVEAIVYAISLFHWNMGSESVSIIYAGTPSGSPMRRLITDQAAHLAHDDSKDGPGWMSFFDGYPQEALLDILKAMSKLRRGFKREVTASPTFLEPYLEKQGLKSERYEERSGAEKNYGCSEGKKKSKSKKLVTRAQQSGGS